MRSLACSALLMWLEALFLTACITLAEDRRDSAEPPHRRSEALLLDRIAQRSFGAAAHFARCRADSCPSITPKTLATLAPSQPIALDGPRLPIASEVGRQANDAGAPIPAATPTEPTTAPSQLREERVVVQFSSGNAQLSTEGKEALRKTLPLARASERILINGRTDSIGSDEANQSLAFARALAVREFIRTALPDLPNVIAISARGNCCFIADNATPQGRQKNRRVEVVFNVAQPTQLN